MDSPNAQINVSLQSLAASSFCEIPIESISCAGCSREIASAAHESEAAFIAGCRCLMCPNWYACPECAAEEAQTHRVSHLNHITYCISREDERMACDAAKAHVPMKPLAFVAESFFVPLSRMVVPALATWLQVRRCFLNSIMRARRVATS